MPAPTTDRSAPRRTARRAPRGARAFTLLEMMLVIMIIGLLMGVAVWNIVGVGKDARIKTSVTTMRQIDSMLKVYNLDYGTYPPALTALVPKYTDKVPQDAWKRPLGYFPNPPGSPKPFTLYSTGESGEAGNEDNIDFWKVDEKGNPVGGT